jgi:hypothetical protein
MKVSLLTVIATVAGLTCFLQGEARAQYPYRSGGFSNPPPSMTRPTVSPYISLGRGGNAGLNYFSIVRPTLDFRTQEDRQRQKLRDLDRRVEDVDREFSLPRSGHSTYFNTYSHFYRK